MKTKVKDNVIFYESFHGKAMNDNPFAIFKYLVESNKYKHYIHVWSLNDWEDNKYVSYYSKYHNVKFIKPYSKDYYYYLASAKYLFHNVTLPPFFIKKKEQVYTNTWHGTPLKTLGKEMEGNVTQNYNVQRNFLQTDYLLSPNTFTTDKLINSYDIDGIYTGEVLENGYPRIDSIFNKSDVLESFLEKEGIDLTKEVLLYAPTWRGATGRVQDTFEDLYKRLSYISAQIKSSDKQLLVKVHPLMYQFIKNESFDGILFIPDWVDANELLYFVDILITDYSSIFFDFLVTNKPIIFFMYDKEEYQKTRGLYFNLDDLPGEICVTNEELVSAILDDSFTDVGLIENIQNFKKQFIPYDHGNVTEQYVNKIIGEEDSVAKVLSFKNDKKNIIIYGGALLNNGITSSLINLSKNLDYDKYNLIVVDKNAANAQFNDNVKRLSDKAHVIYRNNGMDLTYPEWIKYHRLFNRSIVEDIDQQKSFVSREWQRILGDTRIDIAIDFGGYAPFWSYMMAFSKAKTKIIYQHNDMMKEMEKNVAGRYVHKKNLTLIFQLYKFFDHIASVGKLTMIQNKDSLKDMVDEKKFTYVPNLLDKEYLFDHKINPQLKVKSIMNEEKLIIDEISDFGRNEIVGISIPTNEGKNFITIGRLSPEKDQEKLLFAFKQILESTQQDHQLYIVGSGEYEQKLKATAYGLNLQENVIFVGQTKHAMELLDKCDLFIFPSNHEGQPMTLLECLALNIPVVATNIPGNISVLGNENGLVVENSVEGLVNGIKAYLNGQEIKSFIDVDIYNQEALERFYSMLNS
ncbi:glycosyltransferase [Enterococcus gallinarum]|uniref:glycosyltransferase n=1 Tax=Enterococcus gallinarum TaxID=1353 RepID=UPI00321AF444